jgi:hypothetical protein
MRRTSKTSNTRHPIAPGDDASGERNAQKAKKRG